MFAAVREAYGIARQENLKLRDFPTLDARRAVRLRVPARPEADGRGRRRGPSFRGTPVGRSRGSAVGMRSSSPVRRRSSDDSARRSSSDDSREPKLLGDIEPGRAEGPRDRGREDRLSAGHAGDGPRPRGRPRRRHGEAGRDVRGGARGLRHRAPGEPEAPRLPDAQARRRVRVRLPARPEADGRLRRGAVIPRDSAAAVPRDLPVAVPRRPLRPSSSDDRPSRQLLGCAAPTAPPSAEPGRGEGPRDRGREDRLPRGHAGDGPRPRGRPRRRHREAGGDVRGGARGLRHRAPGEPEAPRLPDAEARRRSSSTTSGPT